MPWIKFLFTTSIDLLLIQTKIMFSIIIGSRHLMLQLYYYCSIYIHKPQPSQKSISNGIIEGAAATRTICTWKVHVHKI